MEALKQIKKVCLRGDPVLLISMIAALVSAIFIPPSKEYFEYLDLRVICLLLSLMLVVAGLQKAGAFELLTKRLLKMVHNTRTLSMVLVGICFFSSMLITNDVALITFVPLGVMILKKTQKQKLFIPVIVLQTVAANLGSMLTPLGNPQNLYLYSAFNMNVLSFLRIMALPSAVSLLLLYAAIFFIKPEHIKPLNDAHSTTVGAGQILPWVIFFIICLLAVLRILPYGLALGAVIAWALLSDRTLLYEADYGLLFTFAFLFVFIGNIKSIPAVSHALSSIVTGREVGIGILLSQIISNVPAAMLLSKFTSNFSGLLIGVNLGGLGTLIASMASVISYKQYGATDGAQTGKYLAVFTAVNLLFLLVLWGTMALIAAAR